MNVIEKLIGVIEIVFLNELLQLLRAVKVGMIPKSFFMSRSDSAV